MEASDPRAEIADRLRGRILRGRRAGLVAPGDRLPASRDVAAEFGVDHRLVLDAYRLLEAERVVEMRPRGGVYVGGGDGTPLPSAGWLAEVLVQGINREIPAGELHDWLRRAVETLRLRAGVVQGTADQVAGLCRELREYYGLAASGVEVGVLAEGEEPASLRAADLLVTTAGCEAVVRPLAVRLRKRLLVVEVRPDLIGGEWRMLLEQPVYLVAASEDFVALVQRYFSGVPGADRILPRVVGRDRVDDIPAAAAVYLTAGAREKLGGEPVPGRILPAGRFLSTESGRELLRFIVEANLRAAAAVEAMGPRT